MGKPSADDLDLKLPLITDGERALPLSTDGDTEACGVDGGEDSEPEASAAASDEEVGLDTETGMSDGFDASSLIAPEPIEGSDLDSASGLDLDESLDGEEEEESWIDESEGGGALWEPEDLGEDLVPSPADEGLEGVDDAAEATDDDSYDDDPAPATRPENDDDDDPSGHDLDEDWMRELPDSR